MFYKLKAYLLYLKIKKDSSINISQHMNKTCYKTEFCEYFISYLWNKDSSIIKKNINIIKDFFETFYHFKEDDEKKASFSLHHFIIIFALYIRNKNMSDYYFNLFFNNKKLSYFDLIMFMYCSKFFYLGNDGNIDPEIDKFRIHISNYFHSQHQKNDFDGNQNKQLSLLISHLFSENEELWQDEKFETVFKKFNLLSIEDKNRVLYDAYHNYFYHTFSKKINNFFNIEIHYFTLMIGEPLHITSKILKIYPDYNLTFKSHTENSILKDISEYIEYLNKGREKVPVQSNFGRCISGIFEHISLGEHNVNIMKNLFNHSKFEHIEHFSIFKAKCEQLDLNKIIDCNINAKTNNKKRL